MEEKINLLKKAIMAEAPQVPFVLDQIGAAIDWAIEGHEEGGIIKTLETALDVAKYVKSISEPNFYKTHLLITSLIGDIEGVLEDDKFKMYQTASGATEKAIKSIILDKGLIEKYGCFKALGIHLAQVYHINEEYLMLLLYGILHDLKDITAGLKQANVKAPITPQDYISVLGYAYAIQSFKISNFNLLNETKALINEISIILNNDVTY